MSSTPAGTELRTRWPLLAGCVLGLAVGVHSLPFYTAGLFIGPLTSEFGWTRAEASLAPTLLIAMLALSAPLVGTLIDRWGERAITIASLAFTACGFLVLAAQPGSLSFFLTAFVLVALLGSGSSTLAFSRIIVRNFVAARGTALGVGMIGTGLASTLAPLLLGPIISGQGWRAGYLALALIVGFSAPAIWLLLRSEARTAEAQDQDGMVGATVSEALRTTTFWKLGLCFLLVALASPGLVVHFIPLLTDAGVSQDRAAATASLIGICLIAGRLGAGVLFDIAFAPRVASALMIASAGGLSVFAFGGPAYAPLGAVAIGLSFGAEIDLVGYLCARYFGMRSYGRLYGLLYAMVLIGTSISPLAYGLVRDRSGSYSHALLAAAAALALSAVIFLTMKRFDAAADQPSA